MLHASSSSSHDEKPYPTHLAPRLTGQCKLLLIVYACLLLGNLLGGTFFNVYLWKVKQDFAMIAWFSLITHFTTAITFWLAGKWVKSCDKMQSLRVGLACFVAFYAVILFLGSHSVEYVVWLGILQGIASGLFWLAFHVVYFEVTSQHNRDRFNRFSGLLNCLVNMGIPWLAGWWITQFSNGTGYTLVFTCAFVSFSLSVVFSFFLEKRKQQGSYVWALPWKCMQVPHAPWRVVGGAMWAQGLREGVYTFVISVLLFTLVADEAHVGMYFFVTSLISMCSYVLLGKWLTPRYRSNVMQWGTLLLWVAMLPWIFQFHLVTLWIYGIVVAIGLPWYMTPLLSTVFDWIGRDAESVAHREEYIVFREISLNAGRMAGVVFFLVIQASSKFEVLFPWFLLTISMAPWLSWFLLRKSLYSYREALDNDMKNSY